MKSISAAAVLLFLLLVTNCQHVSTDELLSGTAIKSPLKLSPTNVSVIESQSIQFTVTGGNPPYTFKVFNGGGSVSGSTYTAPNSIGSAVVTVSDASGTSLASLITIISNANCPTNYIPVPFNNAVGTTANFCVAKYEMKCSNDPTGAGCSGLPVSKAADNQESTTWISSPQALIPTPALASAALISESCRGARPVRVIRPGLSALLQTRQKPNL